MYSTGCGQADTLLWRTGRCSCEENYETLSGISALCLLSLLYCSPAGAMGGTVVAWGDNSYGQTNVPLTLTNAIALATLGGSAGYSLALRAMNGFGITVGLLPGAIILRAKQPPRPPH